MSLYVIDPYRFGSRSYATVLQEDYGANEVWPLVDISSGTTITAFVNSARNGTLTGWDLQNAAGPVTGTLAPYSDGVNDTGVITSASFTSIFNGDVGGIFCWLANADWTAAQADFIIITGTGGSLIRMYHLTNSGFFRMQRIDSGGTQTVQVSGLSSTSFISWAITWDTGADEFKAYQNGSQVGTTQTGLASFTTPLVGGVQLGGSGAASWYGHMAYCAVIFGSTWTGAQILGMHNDASTAGAD